MSSPIAAAAVDPAFSSLSAQFSSLRDEFESELEPELCDSASIDVSAIRDVCRHYLNEFINLSEPFVSSSTSSLPSSLDELFVSEPLVSNSLRPKLWKILLACHNKDESGIENWNLADENNDTAVMKQIILDVTRTRVSESRFNADSVELMKKLLAFYCKSRSVDYKQGLNEILAPMMICMQDGGESQGVIFNCFYSLISKFLPSIFNDAEFESLRAIFRAFRLLLKYHDPLLCAHVDDSDILPELYATPWFITLFARDLPLPYVFFLWDIYLIEDDPFFHYFIALALLIQQRTLLLSTDPASLPMAMRNLNIQNFAQLIRQARILRSATPLPFRQQLSEISHKLSKNPHLDLYSAYMKSLPCLSIPSSDIVHQAYQENLSHGSNKYILLDIRDRRQFDSGHLPCAIHIEPDEIFFPERVKLLIERFQGMRDCHLCFVGNSMKTFQQTLKESNEAARTSNVNSKSGIEGIFINLLEQKIFNPRPNYFLGHELEEFKLFEEENSNTKKSTKAAIPQLPNAESFTFPSQSALLDPYLASFVSLFLSNGFPHVSVCEGAYPACHFLVLTSRTSNELVDHDKRQCANCSPSWFNNQREELEKKRVKYEKERQKQLKEQESSFKFGKISFPKWGKKSEKEETKTELKLPQNADATASSSNAKPAAAEVSESASDEEKLKPANSTSVSLKELFFGDSPFFEKKPATTNSQPSNAATTAAIGKESDKPKEKTHEIPSVSIEDSFKEKTQDLKRAMKSLFLFSDKPAAEKAPAVKRLSDRSGETDAAIDIRSWLSRSADVALFNCHEVRKIANSNQGMLIPRILAISSGYIIELRPDNQPAPEIEKPQPKPKKQPKPVAAPAPPAVDAPPAGPIFSIGAPTDASATIASESSDDGVYYSPTDSNVSSDSLSALVLTRPKTQNLNPHNEGFTLTGSGLAFLKKKRRIAELDRITSKKERPCLLTFHWKSAEQNSSMLSPQKTGNSPTPQKFQTIFMIDRPKDCISIVRQKFVRAREAQIKREDEGKQSGEEFPNISPGSTPRSSINSAQQALSDPAITGASIDSFLDRLESHETDENDAEERENHKSTDTEEVKEKEVATEKSPNQADSQPDPVDSSPQPLPDSDPLADAADVDEMFEQMLAGENFGAEELESAGSLDNLDDFEREMERIASEAEAEKLRNTN